MSQDALPPSSDTRADAERVVAAMGQWRRRSQVIRIFRIALPAAMAVLVLIILSWVAVKSLLASLPDLASRGAVIRMTNPRFYGQDERGRSFVLSAKEAVRLTKGDGEVRLSDPLLRLTTGPNRRLQVMAKSGVYDQGTRDARLSGDVKVSDSASGFQLVTGEAQIDTKTGVVTGKSPVKGVGPIGQISASSYAIYGHGARMTFTGNVKARIEQRRRGRPAEGGAR